VILAVSAATPSLAHAVERGKDWQHSLQVVANLRRSRGRAPAVVLLGGSSARECTVSDTAWARQIRRRSGFDVTVYNLGSKHRTYSEDLEFVKLLPRGGDTLVYIGVNLGRFCLDVQPASVRLPRAETLPKHRHQHVYSSDHIQNAFTKRSYVSYWMQHRYPEFAANYESELAVLERIIRVCKRRGLRVALVDLPRDLPTIGDAFAVPVGRYHAGCARLAAKYEVSWLTFCAACDFEDDDFFDIFHLVEPGRVKYQSVLSDKTIRLLKRYGMVSGAASASASVTPAPSLPVEHAAAEDESSAAVRAYIAAVAATMIVTIAVSYEVGRRRAA
jgi:hypothetical protein